jgi:hypothetical protein
MTCDLFKLADRLNAELEALQQRANNLNLPDDIEAFIDSGIAEAEKLPKGEPLRQATLNQLHHARKSFHINDEPALRLAIYRSLEQLKDARFNGWLGGIRRQYGKDAEHRRQQVKEERGPEWNRWQAEADKIRAESVVELSVAEVARRVKARLDVKESERTIRNRIS